MIVEDVRSERSFVESPLPPRAPAPAPWDSTPSPRPRDYSPGQESTATRDTEKDREIEKEKEETPEQSNKKNSKHVRVVASNRSRPRTKTNEIARLLDDLCEGSWVNTVRRVSSSSRRLAEEAIVERHRNRNKKKVEKDRKNERAKEQRTSFASSSSIATPVQPKSARRRLKQLSDDSSTSDSFSDSDSAVQSSRKSLMQGKKRSETKTKHSTINMLDMSTSRSSESDSEERLITKKGKKRRILLEEKKCVGRKKLNSTNSLNLDTKKKTKTLEKKRRDTNTDEEAITQHDPATTCALNSECTKPQNEQVGWIFCDDCQNWFHNICILGREEAPDDEFFYCGCKTKKKSKRR
ncbi:hypothetical protein DICVIV_08391 [Dictyocaulus viviparus]|uniref:PHD-finger n=1 Tax=Dictyocaulus viviparus TaxID=29172 RepID=A0A0D8XP25_DICVI|nr:hypothetical protein DICVIV_08391 [Dictyocaulus viviparus]